MVNDCKKIKKVIKNSILIVKVVDKYALSAYNNIHEVEKTCQRAKTKPTNRRGDKMIIQDALNFLEITGDYNQEIIKKAYRRASSKFHPDKGGSTVMMQIINEAYEILKDCTGTGTAAPKEETDNAQNYPEELNEAINKIIDLEGIEIEVCGVWVWVTGNTKPHAKKLGRKEGGAGFFYAKKKVAWYFRPADYKSLSRGVFSLNELRNTSKRINSDNI